MNVLAFDAKQLATSGQDVQLRSFPVKPLRQRGRHLDDVLAAIEDQQHPLVSQECHEAVRWVARWSWQSKRRCDNAGYERRVADRAEIDETHLAGELRQQRVPDRN